MNKFLKRIIAGAAVLVMTFAAVSCEKNQDDPENNTPEPTEEAEMLDYGDGFNVTVLKEGGYNITTVNVEIEGLDRSYHYIIGSDLHIIKYSDEVAEDYVDTVLNRIKMFTASNGVTSLSQWERLPDMLNQTGADAIFFNADMIDYNSIANVNAFKEGLDKLTIPYYYMRADHDSKPSYLKITDKTRANKRQNELCANDEIFVIENDKFIILCINNALTNTTAKKLKQIEEIIYGTKPVLLITHPPFDSDADKSLSEAIWNREKTNCTLGENTTYTYFDGTMFKYIEAVKSEKSMVTDIFAGHIHFLWDGKVNERIDEHIFSTLAGYNIGVINVIPAEKQ